MELELAPHEEGVSVEVTLEQLYEELGGQGILGVLE